MGDSMSQSAIRDYLRAAVGPDSTGPADGELIARFAATRDEAAFELLVWRHAALVQRICRAVLRDHHAAEDAAQAAFLVLARKAHTISERGSVVGWLYRVARRIAVRLAKDRARCAASSQGLERVADASPEADARPDELAALCAEVDRLPQRYRIPVLLCFFEGLTHAEAARRTGWPVGTVAGRLARAKALLARRLSRRGIGLAGVVLGVPAGGFVGSTARAAAAFATRSPVVPGVEPAISRLAEGAMTMTATTWKLTAASIAVVFAAALSAWGYAARSEPQATAQPPAQPPAQPTKPAKPGAPPPSALTPAETRSAHAAQRELSKNHLKQILLAMHSYCDANGHFPRDITDKEGKPLLSWRVAILPYVEEGPLYNQFKLDEPWDSENNKKLLAKMPAVYRVGFEPKGTTRTYYQGFSGPGAMFEPGKDIKFASVTDGLSNTLAVVECGPPVEWSKPADLPYDPKKKLPKLELPFKNTLIVGMGDGSANALKPDLDEATLRLLIERADGQPVSVADLVAKFPLDKEELKSAQDVLKRNEKMIEPIAEQLREQQKLLLEVAKRKNPADPIKGIDLERLGRVQQELEHGLAAITKENEELRKQLEEKK